MDAAAPGSRPRLLWNLVTALSAAAGIFLNFREPFASKNTLLFFTTQSNLWILLACLAVMCFDLGGRRIPRGLFLLKYVLTVSITVTGVVYNLILAPQYGLHYGSILRAYSVSVVLLHVVVPVLSLVSFLAFDAGELRRAHAWLGPVPLLAYAVFIEILACASPGGYLFDGLDGPSRFPYFFLDYTRSGWFTLSADITRLGVFYWLAFGLALAYALSRLLLFLHRRTAGLRAPKSISK